MKQVIGYNCDFLQINNGVPECTNPKRQAISRLCHPFDLACEDATFNKVFGNSSKRVPCYECDHYCGAQVFDETSSVRRCGDHVFSLSCTYKDRCPAKVLTQRQVDLGGFCRLHSKAVLWYDSCPDHRKEGDL